MFKEWNRLFRNDAAYTWAVLLLVSIPFFPEYCAPVLGIASLGFAVADARRRNAAVVIGSVGKLLLIYMAYTAIGTLYSAHPLNSLSTFAMWLTMFCGYLTATTVLCDRRRLHTALLFIGVVAAIIGVIACVQYLFLSILHKKVPNQLWILPDTFFYKYFPINVDLTMGAERASGTFNNPNILGEYVIMVLPLVGYYAFSEIRTRRSLLARLFMFLAVLGAAVTMSRGAYIALLSMLLLIVLTNLKRITPFALCLVAGISLIPEAITSRFLSIGQGGNDYAIWERFEAWEVAIRTIVTHPLFGLGPGINNFWEELRNAGVWAPHAHNLILQLLVEGGFIALFIMCLIAIKVLQIGLDLSNRNRRGSGLGNALVIFVVAFIVYGMVDYPFLSPKLVGIFLMVLGIADATAHIYLQQPPLELVAVPKTVWHKIRSRFSRNRGQTKKKPRSSKKF